MVKWDTFWDPISLTLFPTYLSSFPPKLNHHTSSQNSNYPHYWNTSSLLSMQGDSPAPTRLPLRDGNLAPKTVCENYLCWCLYNTLLFSIILTTAIGSHPSRCYYLIVEVRKPALRCKMSGQGSCIQWAAMVLTIIRSAENWPASFLCHF